MIVGKANQQIETQSNKAAESSEAWTDVYLLKRVEAAAYRKLATNGITVDSRMLIKSKLFSAVAAEWKSSLGEACKGRLDEQQADRLTKACDTFIMAQAMKVIPFAANFTKRSQPDFNSLKMEWQLTFRGKQEMDLVEQRQHVRLHINETKRKLEELQKLEANGNAGSYLDRIKDTQARLLKLHEVSQAIEVEIAKQSEVVK